MPIQKKLWKVDFFKNNDENGGAMAEAIKNCQPDQIVIHSQTKKEGRVWGHTTPTIFVNLLEKNYGLYEVITQFPHKVYFDIDKHEGANETYLENIKNIIWQFFPNAEMAISGSITETKTSYHIVLQNYVITSEQERDQIKHIVKFLCEKYDESFDWKVYTKNRNMKCINQSKIDGRIQAIIENPDFKAHCITCFVPSHSLPFAELPEEVKEQVLLTKSKKTFDLGTLPKLCLTSPDDFDLANTTPEEILSLLPIDRSFNHDYTHLVARFCFHNSVDFQLFLTWISKKHSPLTNEVQIKWQNHWNKLDKFPPVSIERITTILTYFYPHIKKDIHYRKFSQSFFLPSENITKIETISQTCFETPHKYSVFNVGMGAGKTAQSIDYLKYKHNFLWIAPNRALATNTQKRFEQEDIEVFHYESMNTKQKKEGKLNEQQKLICCLNSIHYIEKATYDIVIIDEIETLLDKFLGDFLEQGKAQLKQRIWNNFLRILRSAKKVILLDAFITKKTINFIQDVETASFVIFERIFEPQTRTIKYINSLEAMEQDIVDKVRNNQKVFVFYPYKKRVDLFLSMDDLYNLIYKATGKDGIYYNADVDDVVKKGLKDVNATWSNTNFIITNNIITCGVNYEHMDFDYVYIYIASHNSPRDLIQVSYRVRHLNSGVIKVCYMGRMTPPNTWLNDCYKINCPIYSHLFTDILIERKAPMKKAIQLLFQKANYKQTTEEFVINDAVSIELKKIKDNLEFGMSYSTIFDIDWSQAEAIEELCFSQQASLMDKFALKKYYFKKSFIDEDADLLQYIWNEDFLFFFHRLTQVLSDPNNLFLQIANENKLDMLFPYEVKKIKLSETLLDKIFKEFSFKFVSRNSSTIKIVKEIYNSYFGKHIVKGNYMPNKHIEYYIKPEIYDLFEFAKTNLILDKLTSLTYISVVKNICEDNCIEI